jgi:ABC-2 type transport system ATP-binding protein
MVLRVEHLTKDFGSFKAVDDVSFRVAAAETVGLIGANGAGKSTTIHMLLGMILPTAGVIHLFDKDPRRYREAVFARLNFTSPYVGFPSRLTVRQNLMVYARLYNIRNNRTKIGELMGLLGVDQLADTPMARLSSGETSRVGLCKALLNDPELLLLDEPLASLDPHAAADVQQILIDMQRRHGTAILYTSHNMAQVEQLCTQIVFLSRGRVIARGSLLDVTRQLLHEDRDAPALDEVYMRIGGRRRPDAAA